MRELVEAAVAAAARSGIMASIVIVDGRNQPAEEKSEDIIAASSETSPELGKVLERNKVLEGRLAKSDAEVPNLRQQITNSAKRVIELVREKKDLQEKLSANGSGSESGLTDIASLQQLKTAEEEIIRLKVELADKPVQPGRMATNEVEQPGEITSLDNEVIDVLGIDGPLNRKLKKLGAKTITELRQCLLGGKLIGWKIKKNDIIDIGRRLLSHPSGPATLSASTTSSSLAASASDIPNGHKDVPWSDRLRAAFSKRADVKKVEVVVEELKAVLEKLELGDESVEVIAKAQSDVTRMMDMKDRHHAQQTALIYSLGLDPNSDNVLDALKRAGLNDLFSKYQNAENLAMAVASA